MTNVLKMVEDFLRDVPDDPERVNIIILMPYMDAPHLFNVARVDLAEAAEGFKSMLVTARVPPEEFGPHASRSIMAVTLMREHEGIGAIVGPLHTLMEVAGSTPEEVQTYRYAAFIGTADQTLSGGDVTLEAFMETVRPLLEDWGPTMTRESLAQRVGLPLDKINSEPAPTLH